MKNLLALLSVVFTNEKITKNKGVKDLLTDLDDVLISLDRGRYIESFKKIGFRDIEEKFCTHQLDEIFLQQEKGLITPAEFRDGIREMVGKMVSDRQISTIWNSFSVDIPTYELDLLFKLRRKYIICLSSNTNDICWEWIYKNAFPYHTSKVGDCSERAYLSYEMGIARPESKMFKTAAEGVGIDPKETFLIDDSKINCKVAQELGISAYMPKASEDWSRLFREEWECKYVGYE